MDERKIYIKLDGGLVNDVTDIPANTTVILMDYDVEGAAEDTELSKDTNGREYIEFIYESDEKPATIEIQCKNVMWESGEDGHGPEWETWGSYTDPTEALKAFVRAVSDERIDGVNLYWRVQG